MNTPTPVRLSGPRLFADYFGRQPVSFTRRDVLALHTEIETAVRSKFQQIGGPELRPIVADALPGGQFAKAVRELQKETRGINVNELQAFCRATVRNGQTEWRLLYNLHNLAKVRDELAQLGAGTGNIILSQVTGTLYGSWYEKLDLKASDVFSQFNFASKGWGNYFSQTPHNEADLLRNEQAYAQLAAASIPQPYLPIFSDHGVFAALTLLKLEKAEGFDALVNLMHNPVGLRPDTNGYRFASTLRGYWRLYLDANSKLGDKNISYDTVFGGRLD